MAYPDCGPFDYEEIVDDVLDCECWSAMNGWCSREDKLGPEPADRSLCGVPRPGSGCEQ